ncbi:alpha/beta hydrolase [Ohtaekwangia koreensis]|uniref:Pimeloyl-ACP methyl ester carboxylesterase n=1 Tax=Ohtaekwangia koreensis TaxID=688867 RepID=A0A1T5MLB3_9BACT|nr:alpha/beta hydrolase [Ohtaekwangia koreensis]SKC88986.1 Pimeloyl-ACP methyl ester carboxylesterase [Ohtaekwangia koreensis]
MKKDNTPFALKVVRWIFPRVERIAPSLAHQYFARLFFTPLRYPTPEKERKAETFSEKFSFDIENKKVQAYRWGNSPRYVLVVHGWAGRGTQFRRFVKPLLAAEYSVIGFDAPAHGNSEGKRTTILEFEQVLKKIYELKGQPDAILAHSFGGGAALYSALNGLPIKKLINIASPTIGDEIIKSFLKAVNASQGTAAFFKDFIMKTYGKPFDEYTALHFIKHLPTPIDLLLIHDADDKEVELKHAEALVKIYPHARLIRTEGLGHTRILKDNAVIRASVTFISSGASGEE